MLESNRSLLALHIATILFGGTSLFSQLIPLSALDITVVRCLVAAVTLFLFLRLYNVQLVLPSKKDYGVVFFLGLLVGLHWVTYFYALQKAGIALGMVIFFCHPLIAIFLEPLVIGGKIRLLDIGLGSIVFAGIYYLVPDFDLANSKTVGIFSALLSAVFMAFRSVFQKAWFSHVSAPVTMFYQTGIVCALFFAVSSKEVYSMSVYGWGLTLLCGVIFTAMPHTLLASALRTLKAKSVSLISCLQPVYGTILALLVLGEKPSSKTLVGGAMILSVAVFESIYGHQHQKANQEAESLS